MKRQSGLSLLSALIVGVIIALALLLGFKTVPVFNEYFAAKKAMAKVAKDIPPTEPPSAFRSAFDRYAQIDDIESITGQDLEVTKSNGTVNISASYHRKLPLFANVSLLFDFDITTNSSATTNAN